jgi:hypothetical protein
MQRYINAIFALLVTGVLVVGIYFVGYQDAGSPKAKQSQLAAPALDPAMSGGAGAGIGIGVLLSLICLVVFPRFRMMLLGPVGEPIDGIVETFQRPIRIVLRLGMFLAFVSLIAGKLGSMFLQ